ncbi:hypothetical protein ACFVGN_37810 [Streptomyces sp. NPDC057757]|uniref:hypothetical protein n=1 Tax=Streptomyces sp. NPDC057757 TaxID=3346241 RepID=UPI003676B66F
MLQQMESGEPVPLIIGMTTMRGLARIAFIAEEFGYAYADLQQTSDNKVVLSVVADSSPRNRESAAQKSGGWRYPLPSLTRALPLLRHPPTASVCHPVSGALTKPVQPVADCQ